MSYDLVLFSTDHCTLCDEALEMLLSMPELAGHSVRVVDVAADDELVRAYGDKLPVLEVRRQACQSPDVLIWPFDRSAVAAALG